MKKILVPIDFSDSSMVAVDTASSIALRSKSQVVLIHVPEPAASDTTFPDAENPDEVEVNFDHVWERQMFSWSSVQRANEELEKLATRAAATGVPASFQICERKNGEEIYEVISRYNADLIVMGSGRFARRDDFVFGSNVQKVIRHAHCPVLTVQLRSPDHDVNNIVFASSLFDNRSLNATLRELIKWYNGTIHLVRINTPRNFKADQEVWQAMKKFASRAGLTNYTVNTFNDISEEEGIINFAAMIRADLIAMATHGRKGLAHVISGSIAEEVARHSTVPVLTKVVPGTDHPPAG